MDQIELTKVISDHFAAWDCEHHNERQKMDLKPQCPTDHSGLIGAGVVFVASIGALLLVAIPTGLIDWVLLLLAIVALVAAGVRAVIELGLLHWFVRKEHRLVP